MNSQQLSTIAMVAAMTLVFFVHWMDFSIVAKIAPAVAEEFSESLPAMARVFTADRLGMAIGALLGGFIADRIGARRVIMTCLALAALCNFITAQPALLHNLWQFSGMRLVIGLLLGTAAPCALSIVSVHSNTRWRSIAITVTLAGAAFGTAAASLLAFQWAPLTGWRSCISICAWLLAITALLLALLRLPPCAEPETTVTTPHIDAAAQNAARPWPRSLRMPLVILGLCYFLTMGLNAALSSWLPSLFYALAHIPTPQFAEISMYMAIPAALGMLSAGWLHRLAQSPATLGWLFVLHGTTIALLGQLPFGNWMFVAALSLYTYTQAACHAALNLTVIDQYPAQIRGSTLGFCMFMGRLGGVLSPMAGALFFRLSLPLTVILGIYALLPLLVAVVLSRATILHTAK